MTTRPIYQTIPAGFTGAYTLNTGYPTPSSISAIAVDVTGNSGTIIPQYIFDNDSITQGAPVAGNVAYGNVRTPTVSYAAGTAIPADGTYEFGADAGHIIFNVTIAPSTPVVLRVRLLEGAALGGSGGSGGATTIADGSDVALGSTTDAAVTNPASAGTLIALTKGLLTVPTTPLPTSVNDATGTQTAAVKAASTAPLATDPALVVGLTPTQFVANSSTQANASLSLPVYAITTAKNSGVAQPVSTAGRVAAGDTGNNSMSVGLVLFNGSTWDPEQNNVEGTALASAARSASTSATLTNYNGKGIVVYINSTVIGTATLTVSILGIDPVSGGTNTLLTGIAIATNTLQVLTVFPGATVSANTVANNILPRTVRISVVQGGTGNATYSVGYALVAA